MRSKVLVFHPALAPYRIDFFNALNNRFDCTFYFEFKSQMGHCFTKGFLQSRCNFSINYLVDKWVIKSRRISLSALGILKRQKPEIVICCEYGPLTILVFFYYSFFRKRFKLYIINDDSIAQAENRSPYSFRYQIRKLITKNSDGVILPSKEVANWYASNITSERKTLVLPIIHDDNIFRKDLASSLPMANAYIEDFNLNNRKVVLFVGRLIKRKNLEVLIKSFSNCEANLSILVIIGEGFLMDELQELVLSLKMKEKVLLLGRKEGAALRAWYALSQVFILPSTLEPFGAVINEALLSGCKVLCSKLAGATSLITNENGLIFDPYNDEELTKKLSLVLNQINPLSSPLKNIKSNLMAFSFEEKITTLFNEL